MSHDKLRCDKHAAVAIGSLADAKQRRDGCHMAMPAPPRDQSYVSAAAHLRGLRALTDCASCPVRSASICGILRPSELVAFEAIGREARFRPRAMILAEGDPADFVFNVTAGVARLFRILPNGQRQILGFALPGDFLGLPPGDRYRFSADAAVQAVACRFPRQRFITFAESHPPFLRTLHDAAVRNLDLAHDQMTQLGPRRADAKVAGFVLAIRRRWIGLNDSSTVVPLPMRRQDLGDYLGLSIATVSRTFTLLDRQRVILIVPQGVRILDPLRLEQIAAL